MGKKLDHIPGRLGASMFLMFVSGVDSAGDWRAASSVVSLLLSLVRLLELLALFAIAALSAAESDTKLLELRLRYNLERIGQPAYPAANALKLGSLSLPANFRTISS